MMISRAKDNIPLDQPNEGPGHVEYYSLPHWPIPWQRVGQLAERRRTAFFIISGFLYGRRVIDDLIRWIEKRIVATDSLLYLSMGNRHRSRVRDMAVCWKRSRHRMPWVSVYSYHFGGVCALDRFSFDC